MQKNNLARREAIRNLMIGTLSMWVDWRPAASFTKSLVTEEEHADKAIRAFIKTVVPGADVSHPRITTIFRDPYYGFNRLRFLFTFNLSRRSLQQFGKLGFHNLSEEERIAVIESGLNAETRIAQLYSAAVFASQITVFTGFYRDQPACEIIEFSEGFQNEATSYPPSPVFADHPMTESGNFR